MLLHVDMIANTTGSGNDTLVPLCLYQVEDDDDLFDQRVQQLAAQMLWVHHCMLLDKISDPETRHWYIQQTVKNGWSRSIIAFQIDTRLHERQGLSPTTRSIYGVSACDTARGNYQLTLYSESVREQRTSLQTQQPGGSEGI